MLLKDRVGIVSGVGPGVGRAAALAFARNGADVALAARSEDPLREVAAEVEALGRRAITVPTDVTDPEQCARLARTAHDELGRIDIVLNNAYAAQPVLPFMDSDLADWRQPTEVNLWGSLNLTQAVVPFMREVGGGRVIMTSTPYRHPREAYGAYIASKGALQAACRVLAVELGPLGITVNTVAVGGTDPGIQRHFDREGVRRNVDPQVVRDEWLQEIPLRHIPTVDQIADTIVYFASEMSAAVTGQYLLVDGGKFID